jgi:hypothetical protein
MPINGKDILASYSQKFVNALHTSLSNVDRVSAGGLYQSIKAPVKILGQKVVLEIRMADYWDYVNEGVDGWNRSVGSPFKFKKAGKRIPLQSMKDFMANRGIQPTMNIKRNQVIAKLKSKKLKKALKADSKEKDLNSAAYAIGYSVKKKGIKPTHFADDVMQGLLKKELEKELKLKIGRQIRVEIKLFTNGNNNSSST